MLKSIVKICFVAIICRNQLLRSYAKINCWADRLDSNVGISCWDLLLRSAVNIICWNHLFVVMCWGIKLRTRVFIKTIWNSKCFELQNQCFKKINTYPAPKSQPFSLELLSCFSCDHPKLLFRMCLDRMWGENKMTESTRSKIVNLNDIYVWSMDICWWPMAYMRCRDKKIWRYRIRNIRSISCFPV